MNPAKYRCEECKHEWEKELYRVSSPIQVIPGLAVCPKCGRFERITWLNYDEVDWLGDDFGEKYNDSETMAESS